MSEYVKQDMQLNPLLEEELDKFDWSALQDEILVEPWMQLDGYDWIGEIDQGIESLSEIGKVEMHLTGLQPPTVSPGQPEHHSTSAPGSYHYIQTKVPRSISDTIEPIVDEPQFFCDFQGCHSNPFKRRGDLKRHQLGHTSIPRWSCPAEGCSRTGSKGFRRLDKLGDHMIQGHKRETHFTCPNVCKLHCTVPHQTLPRDLMAIHGISCKGEENHVSGTLYHTLEYRDCPLPRCPFRINALKEGALDSFQQHLITNHIQRVRADYTLLINSRGYDAATGNVVCPICTQHFHYPGHSAFYRHFINDHLDGLALPGNGKFEVQPWMGVRIRYSISNYEVWNALRACTDTDEEIRQHRRTILNLWPIFEVHPVFNEIGGYPL